MDQRVLLGMLPRVHGIGLPGPADDDAGSCVEDRDEFCVRAGGRTCPSTAVIILEPFLLVTLDVEIDSKGQEPRSLSGQTQNVPENHRLDSRFRMRNELPQVAFFGVPPPATIVVAGQPSPDEASGRDRESRDAGGPTGRRERIQ